MWIVGGLVVAVGVVGFLIYNAAPSGASTTGTIVEAKRAQTDGTNSTDSSPAPTASPTDQSSSSGSATDYSGSDAPAASDAAAAASGGNGRQKDASWSWGSFSFGKRSDNAQSGNDASNKN
jgi:hypothetical protein